MPTKQQIADKVEQFVIDLLHSDYYFDGDKAEQIGHVMKMAFKAAIDAKPPRWNIDDTFTTKHKGLRTITDIIRVFDQNGEMQSYYKANYGVIGSLLSEVYSEATVAKFRRDPVTGDVIESGQ